MQRAPKTPAQYLKQMEEFASRLHEARLDHGLWAEDKRYIRINGGGLRVVSLCANSPCGAVDGQGVRKTTRGLVDTDETARRARIPAGAPKSKPEHLWQAALIEHAIRWRHQLPELLHLRDACDELGFVTDELSLGAIRADVVLVGRRGASWFPVFVELKVKRSMKRLLEQLNAINELSKLDETTRAAFKKFVSSAARVYGSEIGSGIDLDCALKVMIWPSTQGVSTHLARAQQVRVLEFPEGAKPLPRFDAPSLPLTPATSTSVR